MTHEEAVYILERLCHTESKWPGTEDTVEALDMAVAILRSSFSDSEKTEPLTQLDVDKMHFERVCIDYGAEDGDRSVVEDGIVLYGRLYSIDALDGAGLEELLLDAGCRGETLDNTSGTYTVYRRQPEREEGAEHGQTDL